MANIIRQILLLVAGSNPAAPTSIIKGLATFVNPYFYEKLNRGQNGDKFFA